MSIEQSSSRDIHEIARNTDRIARCLELAQKRAQQRQVDTESMGAVALWREEVAAKETVLGFSEWMTWRGGSPFPEKNPYPEETP